jgi:hypothetical protein
MQRETIKNLQDATESLQNSLSSQNQIFGDEQGLLQIAQRCRTAADKVLKELGPVSTPHKIRLPIRALLKLPTIKKLEEELAFCEKALEIQLLVDLR